MVTSKTILNLTNNVLILKDLISPIPTFPKREGVKKGGNAIVTANFDKNNLSI